MSEVEIIWTALAGGFAVMALAEFIQGRIDKRCDEAWKAGYEMGQSIVKGRK